MRKAFNVNIEVTATGTLLFIDEDEFKYFTDEILPNGDVLDYLLKNGHDIEEVSVDVSKPVRVQDDKAVIALADTLSFIETFLDNCAKSRLEGSSEPHVLQEVKDVSKQIIQSIRALHNLPHRRSKPHSECSLEELVRAADSVEDLTNNPGTKNLAKALATSIHALLEEKKS